VHGGINGEANDERLQEETADELSAAAGGVKQRSGDHHAEERRARGMHGDVAGTGEIGEERR